MTGFWNFAEGRFLPHPAVGHLLPFKTREKAYYVGLLPLFAREKVAEGRMRDFLNTRENNP
jgi:hypothetical protein